MKIKYQHKEIHQDITIHYHFVMSLNINKIKCNFVIFFHILL